MKGYVFRFECDKCGLTEYVENPLKVEKKCLQEGCDGMMHASSSPVKNGG